jgi:NAD(P)-dependent dehydrogenase (short-subunit alcohol dehydrogenase family)
MVSPSLYGSASQEKSTNHMATKVWFITGATRGIGSEIAKAAPADGNQVVATGCKLEAMTKALDVTREDQIEVSALLPIIAVVL